MIVKALGLVFIAVCIHHVCKLVYIMGFHKTVYSHRPGKCRNVNPVLTGSEDIALTKNGLAFVSSGSCMGICKNDGLDLRNEKFEGRIYLFDFQNPDKDAVELRLPAEFTGVQFNPHGLDSWYDENTETVYLFVVNHGQNGESVEIFQLDKNKVSMTHVRTIQDPEFHSLNDVLALGKSSFYVSNDGYNRNCWRLLERFMLLKWSSLVYFDGSSAMIAAKDHDLNGLGQSHDGKLIFASRPMDRVFDIYKHNNDNSLELVRSVNIGTSPDNIFVDPQSGDLWFGCHPQAHAFFSHVENFDFPAPSQVIKLQSHGPPDDPFKSVKLFDPFSDTGELISASSGVATYGNGLLIGSVFHKLVYCDMVETDL